MSVEEEVELRDTVAQTLELNGCLSKIRAQLRANLYLALDEDSKTSKQQLCLNNKLKPYLEVPEGQLMFCLVREFLEYFDLDFTVSVYEPESFSGNCYKYEGRQKIIEDLGLKNQEETFSGPILLHLIKSAQMKPNTLRINLSNVNSNQTDEQKDSTSSSLVSPIHEEEVNGHCDVHEVEEVDQNEEYLNATYITKAVKTRKPHMNTDALPVLMEPKDLANDDTFNGTSSIEEETFSSTDHSIDVNEENCMLDPDDVSESKSKFEEKKKLKSKIDLSPLQLNKPHGNDILPSLYSKGCRDRSKELDLDIKDDHEEEKFKVKHSI